MASEGQSSAVSLVLGTAVVEALRRMQRPPDTRVDSALARGIAEREGNTIVGGTIPPLCAGTYITVARLLAAKDGAQLASFSRDGGWGHHRGHREDGVGD